MVLEFINEAIGLDKYIGGQFLRAGIMFFVTFFLLRILLFVLQKSFIAASSKTKSDLDDILIEKSTRPLTYLSFVFGLILTLNELSLGSGVNFVLKNLTTTLLAISVGLLVYVLSSYTKPDDVKLSIDRNNTYISRKKDGISPSEFIAKGFEKSSPNYVKDVLINKTTGEVFCQWSDRPVRIPWFHSDSIVNQRQKWGVIEEVAIIKTFFFQTIRDLLNAEIDAKLNKDREAFIKEYGDPKVEVEWGGKEKSVANEDK